MSMACGPCFLSRPYLFMLMPCQPKTASETSCGVKLGDFVNFRLLLDGFEAGG